MDIHFRPKNENESHLITPDNSSFFHTFSHQVNPTMRRNTSSSFAFLQVLIDCIPFSSCTVYAAVRQNNLCGIFLDWFIDTEWKQFSTIYALSFSGICVA